MYSNVNVNKVVLKVRNVTQQRDSFSCGFFALAYAQALVGNKRPEELDFETNGTLLRKHVVDFVVSNNLTEFPSSAADRREDLGIIEIILAGPQ